MSTMTIQNFAAHGVHGQPTCCLSQLAQQDPLTSSPTVSSTEPSPTRESSPADQKKRKKKKKANKASNDPSSALPGKPTPDAERPSVLCISRNKHWKYISSYHVSPLVSYTLFCQLSGTILSHFSNASSGPVAPTPARVARVPSRPQHRPRSTLWCEATLANSTLAPDRTFTTPRACASSST